MNTASVSRVSVFDSSLALARRHPWLLAWGFVFLVIAALLIYHEVSMSPAEKRVRAYLRAARGGPGEGAITNALGANEIPVLLDIMVKTNSKVRRWLMDYEEKVELALPERAYRWVRHATDATSDYNAAAAALTALASTPAGAAALAPYLKHPDSQIRWSIARMLMQSDASMASVLSDALANEADPAVRSVLAESLLSIDPSNALALAILKPQKAMQAAFQAAFRRRYGPPSPRDAAMPDENALPPAFQRRSGTNR